MKILGDVPFCKGCAERYLRVKKKLQGPGDPGPGQWREGSVLDEFHHWQQQRSQNGQLGIGGDKDLEDFAKEKGIGNRGISILKKHYFGSTEREAYQPGDGWKRLYDERRKDHQRNQQSNPFPWPPKKKQKKTPAPKAASRKQAWSGWGPTAARKHDVDGWQWDQRLSAYVATSTPDNFTCKCGAKLKVPSYTNCKCGKIWNSYVIGTGGENRQAAVEKFLCREVPVRKDVIVANRRTARLNISTSAPQRDKPVILMYGGGFNPPHQGHVGALQDAYNELAGAGYKVDRSIVVPTADKLLATKQMDPQDRLDLQARARVSRAAFPRDINGAPVDVRTEPSEEVERLTGKPRRTDLAAWAQKMYPDHTIINVTGEDAIVPGAPDQFPALYSGALGSNHAGFSYLTMPRDPVEGLSSSKIRAALAAGAPLPGMTPDTERAYRDELARLRVGLPRQARRRRANKDTCPACGKGLRDYDLSGTTDHQGQKWCHGCIPAGVKAQMKKSNLLDAISTRADGEDEDYASDEWPSDHHPGLKDKLKTTPKDWHHRDINQRWTAT